ncbi:Trehalase [Eumeta japonica]|uniref:Trehalase n=1 Tax=Eumeta variegata TaxID=151549 RepID=A0A4C1VBR1_EUMVA|nr:Trehalase [Eumeta japonica]
MPNGVLLATMNSKNVSRQAHLAIHNGVLIPTLSGSGSWVWQKKNESRMNAVEMRSLRSIMIYCYGPLLNTVQMAGLYNDSKTFVDMKMKMSPNITMQHFLEMMNRTESRPTKADIQEFVNQNFDKEGSEFENWVPDDWKEYPGPDLSYGFLGFSPGPRGFEGPTAKSTFLNKIKDPLLHKWASSLHGLWLDLGRKMKDEVKHNPDLYSIIYVDHPVIVPGGRFREFYYWDSYWIVKGLLLSEMLSTAEGMVRNFLDIVERIGFIPNGGRIYYAMRSQPPLLIPMVKSLVDHEGFKDDSFLSQHIHTLDREFDHWISNHTVEVEHDNQKICIKPVLIELLHSKKTNYAEFEDNRTYSLGDLVMNRYKLMRYVDQSQGPRPESYKEDIDCAKHFDSNEKKEELYAELKAAAESGWDFSSRWFILNGTNKGNLTNLKTRSIIPVDLNAIMCWNAQLMTEFHERLGNNEKASYYRDIHTRMLEAIDKVLWHEDVGVWLDFNLESGRSRDYFYPSNVAPLWTGCYHKSKNDYYVSRVINYLDKVKVDIFEGGIPTTFEHSGEQWDYPNAWPPLQYMVVMGLADTGQPEAMRLAYEIATKWVRSNFEVWKEKSAMLEKYDATIFGGYGGGGEYVVQTGFGWTNGVIMELLNRYGQEKSRNALHTFTDTGAVQSMVSVGVFYGDGRVSARVWVSPRLGPRPLASSRGYYKPVAGLTETLSAVDAFEDSPTHDGAVVGAHVGAGGVMTALLVIIASFAAGALG